MKFKASVSFRQPEGDVYGENMKTASCKVIELAENGILSWETIAREALQYMSEDDVADMANSCDWLE